MPEQLTIESIRKVGHTLVVLYAETSATLPGCTVVFGDRGVFDEFCDRRVVKPQDALLQRVLRRIRTADPTLANVGLLSNLKYERPDEREVP